MPPVATLDDDSPRGRFVFEVLRILEEWHQVPHCRAIRLVEGFPEVIDYEFRCGRADRAASSLLIVEEEES